ncbi:MAG: hypothetical protein WD512_16515 [Candidatus Paceibacterota bacterium]
MIKCDDCKIKYPYKLVNFFNSNLGSGWLCGICSLARKNAIHGTKDISFSGEEAERLRRLAVEFRNLRD